MGDLLYCVAYYSLGFLVFVGLIITVGISDSARYRLKFLMFILYLIIFPMVTSPWMLIRGRDAKTLLPMCWGLRQMSKLMGIKFQPRGEENIVKDTGCVVLINHQSSVDIYATGVLISMLKNCATVMKKSLQYCGFFGLMCWSGGSIFIDRQKSAVAHDVLNDAISAIQDKKMKVLLYPEGHRHAGKTLLPFKKGAFHIAIDSQAPIQPIVLSKYYFLNSKKRRFDSGTCYITILPAIPTKGLTKEDLPKLLETTYELMNKVFKETSQEVVKEHLEELKNELLE